MPQEKAWEQKYQNSQLLKMGDELRSDLMCYLNFLEKKKGLI